MKPLARNLGIGCAVVAVVSVGSCVISIKQYMHPRAIGTVPAASALAVTTGAWLPRSVSRIADPSAITPIIAKMNTQVGSGWHPVVGEEPLASISVNIETVAPGVTYWEIGDIWFRAGGLYKEVPVPERDELAAMVMGAPHVTVDAGW